MLSLHGHPILRAMAQQTMPWRVELSGQGGSIAQNVPASLQGEDKLTISYSEIGLGQTQQIVNAYIPTKLPDGTDTPVRQIQSLRVTGGPTNVYDGQIISVVGAVANDDGITVWLKCRITGWT